MWIVLICGIWWVEKLLMYYGQYFKIIQILVNAKNQNEVVIHADPNVRADSEVSICLIFQRKSNPVLYSSPTMTKFVEGGGKTC